MLDKYLIYLEYITNKFQSFFENQKDYICCKKGCSKCCHKAQFPYSEIEFRLIYEGLKSLEPNIQKQVLDNIDKIIIDKQKHNEEKSQEKFRYDCPFLIDDACSVYVYRGLICRSFGLMSFVPNSEETPKIPFCAYEGLNYSNVLDEVKNNISDVKFAESKFVKEPMAYNIDYATLINEEIAKGFGFKFGEVKPLIEWFIQWKEELMEKLNNFH